VEILAGMVREDDGAAHLVIMHMRQAVAAAVTEVNNSRGL
jgi:hypothetical protein